MNTKQKDQSINIADKIDCHVFDFSADLNSVLAICSEHGIKKIVVPQGMVEECCDTIGVQKKRSKPSVTALIDYPYGSSTTDSRCYQIRSAKERGATGVEVSLMSRPIAVNLARDLISDVSKIKSICKQLKMNLTFVVNDNDFFKDSDVFDGICRLLNGQKIPRLSYESNTPNKSKTDQILKVRDIKKIYKKNIKTFVNGVDSEETINFMKAGSDRVGINFREIAQSIYSTEKE